MINALQAIEKYGASPIASWTVEQFADLALHLESNGVFRRIMLDRNRKILSAHPALLQAQ